MKRLITWSCLLATAAIAIGTIPRQITVTGTQGLISAASTEAEAQAIDLYFNERKMPLEGYGHKFILEAARNGLDWRLLPAISVRESSGGLHACGANPFGWSSCQRTFKTIDEAIETVARHLGGNATSTRAYYQGKTVPEILAIYNPPKIMPTYVPEVLAIMAQIGAAAPEEIEIPPVAK